MDAMMKFYPACYALWYSGQRWP